MKARDIMTSNPEVITREDTVKRAAEIMRDHDVGLIPVVDDRASMNLSGVITDRDIAIRFVAAGGGTDDATVGEFMSGGAIASVTPDADIDDVMDRMKRDQIRRIPVCEDRRIVGIIAQADLALQGPGDKKTGDVVEKISEPTGGRGPG